MKKIKNKIPLALLALIFALNYSYAENIFSGTVPTISSFELKGAKYEIANIYANYEVDVDCDVTYFINDSLCLNESVISGNNSYLFNGLKKGNYNISIIAQNSFGSDTVNTSFKVVDLFAKKNIKVTNFAKTTDPVASASPVFNNYGISQKAKGVAAVTTEPEIPGQPLYAATVDYEYEGDGNLLFYMDGVVEDTIAKSGTGADSYTFNDIPPGRRNFRIEWEDKGPARRFWDEEDFFDPRFPGDEGGGPICDPVMQIPISITDLTEVDEDSDNEDPGEAVLTYHIFPESDVEYWVDGVYHSSHPTKASGEVTSPPIGPLAVGHRNITVKASYTYYSNGCTTNPNGWKIRAEKSLTFVVTEPNNTLSIYPDPVSGTEGPISELKVYFITEACQEVILRINNVNDQSKKPFNGGQDYFSLFNLAPGDYKIEVIVKQNDGKTITKRIDYEVAEPAPGAPEVKDITVAKQIIYDTNGDPIYQVRIDYYLTQEADVVIERDEILFSTFDTPPRLNKGYHTFVEHEPSYGFPTGTIMYEFDISNENGTSSAQKLYDFNYFDGNINKPSLSINIVPESEKGRAPLNALINFSSDKEGKFTLYVDGNKKGEFQEAGVKSGSFSYTFEESGLYDIKVMLETQDLYAQKVDSEIKDYRVLKPEEPFIQILAISPDADTEYEPSDVSITVNSNQDGHYYFYRDEVLIDSLEFAVANVDYTHVLMQMGGGEYQIKTEFVNNADLISFDTLSYKTKKVIEITSIIPEPLLAEEPATPTVTFNSYYGGTLEVYKNDELETSYPINAGNDQQYIFEPLAIGEYQLKLKLIKGPEEEFGDSLIYPVQAGQLKLLAYCYDELGNVDFIYGGNVETKPSEFEIRYDYDLQSRLKVVKSKATENSFSHDVQYHYDSADRIDFVEFISTGEIIDYSYYPVTGYLKEIKYGTTFSEKLEYYDNANISKQTVKNNPAQFTDYEYNFTYDDKNRLTSANSPTSAFTENYSYNKDGFILTKSRTDNVYSFAKESGTNRLASLTYNGGSAQSFTYDNKGRLTDDNFSGVSGIQYNYQNLPIALTSGGFDYEYKYNSGGQRIIKKDVTNTSANYYLMDYTGRTLAIYDYYNKKLKSVNIHGNGLLGKIDVDVDNNTDTKYYYLKDHLGNIRQTISEDGVIVGSTDYYPYGEEIDDRDIAIGVTNRYKFNEKERDTETQYDYSIARYYSPKFGSWLTADPMSHLRPGLSPYNYVQNNPMNRIDPFGLTDEGNDEQSRFDELFDWLSLGGEGFSINWLSLYNSIVGDDGQTSEGQSSNTNNSSDNKVKLNDNSKANLITLTGLTSSILADNADYLYWTHYNNFGYDRKVLTMVGGYGELLKFGGRVALGAGVLYDLHRYNQSEIGTSDLIINSSFSIGSFVSASATAPVYIWYQSLPQHFKNQQYINNLQKEIKFPTLPKYGF